MSRRLLAAALPALALTACLESNCAEEGAIDPADLPAAVTQAIEAEYPGGTIVEAEEEDEGYEVEVEDADGVLWEVEIAEDGTILEVEQDDDEEDGDDDCDADDEGDDDDEGHDDDDDGDDDGDDDD